MKKGKEYFAVGVSPNISSDSFDKFFQGKSKEKCYLVPEAVYDWLEENKNFGGYRRYDIDLYDAPVRHESYNYEGKLFKASNSETVKKDLKEQWNIIIPSFEGGLYYTEIKNGNLQIRQDEEGEYDYKSKDSYKAQEELLVEIKDGVLTSVLGRTSKEEAVLESYLLIEYLQKAGIADGDEIKKYKEQRNDLVKDLKIKPLDCYKNITVEGETLFSDIVNLDKNVCVDEWELGVNFGDNKKLIKTRYDDDGGKTIYILQDLKQGSFNGRNEMFYFKDDFSKADAVNFVKDWDWNKSVELKQKHEIQDRMSNGGEKMEGKSNGRR